MVKPWRTAALVAAVLVIGGVVGWAGAVATRPPQEVAAEATYVMVSADEGTVSQSVATIVTATWPVRRVALNQASGTITRVAASRGEQVKAGNVVYRVDERPVAVLKGAVPAFRTLTVGVSGADVTQLTRFLVSKRYLAATTSRYTAAVQRAVRTWQKKIGVPQDGVVHRGDVIFVKSLPMRIALGARFQVGAAVSAGEPAVEALPASPVFAAQYSDFQAKQVSEGMPIRVTAGARAWVGELGPLVVGRDGAVTSTVTGAEGASLCGKQCTQVPLRGTTQLKGETEIQKPVAGVVVPVAAMVANADGSTAVIGEDAARIPVTVRARARGMAVVDGLAAGTQVRVPGQ